MKRILLIIAVISMVLTPIIAILLQTSRVSADERASDGIVAQEVLGIEGALAISEKLAMAGVGPAIMKQGGVIQENLPQIHREIQSRIDNGSASPQAAQRIGALEGSVGALMGAAKGQEKDKLMPAVKKVESSLEDVKSDLSVTRVDWYRLAGIVGAFIAAWMALTLFSSWASRKLDASRPIKSQSRTAS